MNEKVRNGTVQLVDKKLTIIKFWVPNCPGCERIKPFFEELKVTYEKDIQFYDLNFKEHRMYGPVFKLTKMPCVVIMKSWEDFECISGVKHPDSYKEIINNYLS